jgi:hypothetical protein
MSDGHDAVALGEKLGLPAEFKKVFLGVVSPLARVQEDGMSVPG